MHTEPQSLKGQASLRTLKTEQVFLKGKILW